ncbi:MAG: hypothetical protein ABSH08_16845 [Tepidisphaeraceae bacterium]
MSDQEPFFRQLATLLERAGIPFMVSGSLASSFHGDPRATNDFDLVIDPDFDSLNRFVTSLPADWYASKDAAQAALKQRSMFNVVDAGAGWKADLIVRKDRPFSLREFSRKVPATIFGIEVAVVSPEDSILSKLEWSRESGSERQYLDALGVALLNSKSLDRAYLQQWAKELNIEELLIRLLRELDLHNSC